jgi:NAD(P)-dependent dehydrogenase (short-subunit alcohol dehydrogenase family)
VTVSGADQFRYDGRRAVVVGGATGMGAAAAHLLADLGAEIVVLDVQDVPYDVAQAVRVDLRSVPSIDAALDQIGGPIDALFACAGIADGGVGLMQVNFIGHRHLIETAIERELLPAGSAIAGIASIGGLGWDRNTKLIRDLLETAGFDAATEWIATRPELASYTFSKQAMIAYCAWRAPALLRQGIRINCIAPGPTMTPLMDATQMWRDFEADYRQVMGVGGATAEQQAAPLVFLNSDAAEFVSGTVLNVDAGYVGGGTMGAIPAAVVDMLAPPIG